MGRSIPRLLAIMMRKADAAWPRFPGFPWPGWTEVRTRSDFLKASTSKHSSNFCFRRPVLDGNDPPDTQRRVGVALEIWDPLETAEWPSRPRQRQACHTTFVSLNVACGAAFEYPPSETRSRMALHLNLLHEEFQEQRQRQRDPLKIDDGPGRHRRADVPLLTCGSLQDAGNPQPAQCGPA